jgi:hypothetical protein
MQWGDETTPSLRASLSELGDGLNELRGWWLARGLRLKEWRFEPSTSSGSNERTVSYK